MLERVNRAGSALKRKARSALKIGRWDGASICCHIRKEVGQVALGILWSSV